MIVDRINRVLLLVLGLVLTAAGTVGLLARAELLTVEQPGQLYRRLATLVGDNRTLFWSVVAMAAAGAFVGAAWWLRAQFVRRGGRGIGTQQLDRGPRGRLELDPAPVSRAVAADLRAIPGVEASSVRLTELVPTAQAVVRLDVSHDAQMAIVRREVEGVFGRLRQTLGIDRVDAEVRIDLAPPTQRRVQ